MYGEALTRFTISPHANVTSHQHKLRHFHVFLKYTQHYKAFRFLVSHILSHSIHAFDGRSPLTLKSQRDDNARIENGVSTSFTRHISHEKHRNAQAATKRSRIELLVLVRDCDTPSIFSGTEANTLSPRVSLAEFVWIHS